MKILVTGGAGMVGSHAAEYFAQSGHSVLVYDNWNYLKQCKNIICQKADIRDVPTLEKCFTEFQPDIVIHAAGQQSVRGLKKYYNG